MVTVNRITPEWVENLAENEINYCPKTLYEAHEKAKRAFLGKEFTVEATLKFVSTSDGAMIVRPTPRFVG